MTAAISTAGVVVSMLSLTLSFWANRRTSRLSSEQEQLRRMVRSNAIYGLIATYELIDDLGVYMWMSAGEKRVDKEFITSFIAERVNDLNAILGSPAYFLLKRAAATFAEDRRLADEPLVRILGTKLSSTDIGKSLLSDHAPKVGLALLGLETNLWLSTIDALYRLKTVDESAEDIKVITRPSLSNQLMTTQHCQLTSLDDRADW